MTKIFCKGRPCPMRSLAETDMGRRVHEANVTHWTPAEVAGPGRIAVIVHVAEELGGCEYSPDDEAVATELVMQTRGC